MNKIYILRMLGIVPFFLFLMATQLWKMTFAVKMTILIPIMLIGLTSILLKNQPQIKNTRYNYLKLSLAILSVALIFAYQYFK